MSTFRCHFVVHGLLMFGFVLCARGAWAAQIWHTRDIGNTGAIGAAKYEANTFIMNGAGDDIDGATDAFRYLYQYSSGNAAITARVITLEHTHDWAKAGVMMRDGLDPDSLNACIVVTPGKGISFLWRTGKANYGNESISGMRAPAGSNWCGTPASSPLFTPWTVPNGDNSAPR